MAKSFLVPIDLNQQELRNAVVQVLGSDPDPAVNGQIWIHSGSWTLRVRLNGVTVSLGRLDQIAAPTADVSMGGNQITNLSDGVAASDAATVGQLAALQTGMSWKEPVRVATTADATFNTAFQNAAVVDGITLATGDRILIKNQSTGSQNGIYVVNATGAPTRATDADVSAEVPPGMVVPVEEGSANADSVWILTTNGPITLGTTTLSFSEIPVGGGNTYLPGLGLTESPAGTFNIDTAVVSRKTAATNIGDGVATQFDITHNFGTRAVAVSVWRATTPWDEIECEVQKLDTNTVRLVFASAPTTNQFQAVVLG